MQGVHHLVKGRNIPLTAFFFFSVLECFINFDTGIAEWWNTQY